MNQGDGHERGRSHAMDFSYMLNIFVLTIFCILSYNFLLNVVIYAFFFFILSASTSWASFHARPKMWGKGRGWLALFGPSGGM